MSEEHAGDNAGQFETLAQSLYYVQGHVSAVQRDAKGNYGPYATLKAVIAALRPHLQAAGLVIAQMPAGARDGFVSVTTRVLHVASGNVMEVQTSAPLPKPDPQGVGTAITYICRYALMALFALPPTDDDADSVRDTSREIDLEIEVRHLRRLLDATRENWSSVDAIKRGIAEDTYDTAAEAWDELDNDAKQALWVAPTKGGIFTTGERTVMRSDEFRQHAPDARPK